MKRFKVATFNLYNLVLPGVLYYGQRDYSELDYQKKLEWIAGRLRELDADVVGFQEVFHEEALRQALKLSGLGYKHIYVSGEESAELQPRCALASRFPIEECESIEDFPALVPSVLGAESCQFRRPVLRALIRVGQSEVSFFVLHLKSKRPEIPEGFGDDGTGQVLGKAIALGMRGREAVALRLILVEEMKDNSRPVIVLGDLNDSASSVTTEMITGSFPRRGLRGVEKKGVWDTLLYNAGQLETLRASRDIHYTHIHEGHYECLDHIFVSEEFYHQNRRGLGVVEYLRVFNDHLVDRKSWRVGQPVWTSDHAPVLASIRFYKHHS